LKPTRDKDLEQEKKNLRGRVHALTESLHGRRTSGERERLKIVPAGKLRTEQENRPRALVASRRENENPKRLQLIWANSLNNLRTKTRAALQQRASELHTAGYLRSEETKN
jgi:hypothetical protein